MAQDTVATFLIAGAGGRHGATGNLAVRQLLAKKLPVLQISDDDFGAKRREVLGAFIRRGIRRSVIPIATSVDVAKPL